MIEFELPTRALDGDLTCYICANSFCDDDQCGRSLTHLACCTQSICCSCLLKSCKRCGCKEDCDAVVSLCPFCREVCTVDALDVFLGTKSACAQCRESDKAGEATATPRVTPDATPEEDAPAG